MCMNQSIQLRNVDHLNFELIDFRIRNDQSLSAPYENATIFVMPPSSPILFEERKTSNGGRGYFAVQDLLPGDEALQVNEPLAYALNTKDLVVSCESCLITRSDESREKERGKGLELKACTGCRVVKYCSKVSE